MPKLLSRSKHEEFKSNSTLHIRDKKEIREENTRKLEHLRNLVPAVDPSRSTGWRDSLLNGRKMLKY